MKLRIVIPSCVWSARRRRTRWVAQLLRVSQVSLNFFTPRCRDFRVGQICRRDECCSDVNITILGAITGVNSMGVFFLETETPVRYCGGSSARPKRIERAPATLAQNENQGFSQHGPCVRIGPLMRTVALRVQPFPPSCLRGPKRIRDPSRCNL